MTYFEDIVLFYGVLVVSLTVHEAAHAALALLGGDRTAYVGGQVSLNPIPHIRREPFGTVVLPLVILIMSNGSWCMGYASTPIDARWAWNHPVRAALMSAAGPLSNFLLAALAFGGLAAMVEFGYADRLMEFFDSGHHSLIRPVDDSNSVRALGRILTTFLFLNVLLGLLNLFPWPPLDGAGVLEGLFPRYLRPIYGAIRAQPILVIAGFIGLWQILPEVFYPVYKTVITWL